MNDCRDWYNRSYVASGFRAQRRYPNEELIRFLSRTYSNRNDAERRHIRILEVGCGSGANLWAIASEGFEAYGIDLSPPSIALCEQMLVRWGAVANTRVGDMSETGYPDQYFDVVCDIFSSYCLDEKSFSRFLEEVMRLLKPGGRFFSYSPSKNSDAFLDHFPSRKIDSSTLDGIHRMDSPFYGNYYPFRFIDADDYCHAIESRGMKVGYIEIVGRTYGNGAEYFEFVVIDAEKIL